MALLKGVKTEKKLKVDFVDVEFDNPEPEGAKELANQINNPVLPPSSSPFPTFCYPESKAVQDPV
jgi:hypothetical protein